MTKFKDFIRNNNEIIKTLFHIDDNSITIIDKNTREFIKNYKTTKIFIFMPLLKDILNEILKDISTIQLKIIEKFDKNNNQFNYKIFLNENKLFDNITNLYRFNYLIHLNENNSIINVSLSMNKNNIEDDNNPLNKIIIMIMLNYFENEHPSYYKRVVLEKQLKPLITNLSHHSLVLNII